MLNYSHKTDIIIVIRGTTRFEPWLSGFHFLRVTSAHVLPYFISNSLLQSVPCCPHSSKGALSR